MNDKKITFIICYTDDLYLAECEYYIHKLTLPEDYILDIVKIKEAPSMTAGYNAGMKSSDAKYKVYLHQDVFCINPNLIIDMLEIFKDNSIGMIGMVGGINLPKDASFSQKWDVANTYVCDYLSAQKLYTGLNDSETYTNVKMIDGMFMATQYDIDWDEQNFDGWHFYDASQCMKFNSLYNIVIPSKQTYTLHDAGCCSYRGWDNYRKQFCKLYPEFKFENITLPDYSALDEAKKNILNAIIENRINDAIPIFQQFKTLDDSELTLIFLWLNTIIDEINTYDLCYQNNFTAFMENYKKLKFHLYRNFYINDLEYNLSDEEFIKNNNISEVFLQIVKEHSLPDERPVFAAPGLKQQIATELENGDFISAENLLFSTDKWDFELSVINRLFKIFRLEIENNCTKTLFDYSTDIDILIEHFTQVKLLIRRLEYDIEKQTWPEIYNYFKETYVSDWFLYSIILNDSFMQKKVCKNLVTLFSSCEKDNLNTIEFFQKLYDEVKDEN